MLRDLWKALRAGISCARKEYQRRRWLRKFHNGVSSPFD